MCQSNQEAPSEYGCPLLGPGYPPSVLKAKPLGEGYSAHYDKCQHPERNKCACIDQRQRDLSSSPNVRFNTHFYERDRMNERNVSESGSEQKSRRFGTTQPASVLQRSTPNQRSDDER